MNEKTKRILKNVTIAALAVVPSFAMADVDLTMFNEVATEIEKLEQGVKVVGGAIVGVTLVGTGYIVSKRWIKRV